jgi:sulfite reductase beta subunit-like hemoprotein
MAQTKTGNRADRDSLRVAMLDQGCGINEIAAELRVRWGAPCAPPTGTPTD